jgi:hypothetical protein
VPDAENPTSAIQISQHQCNQILKFHSVTFRLVLNATTTSEWSFANTKL